MIIKSFKIFESSSDIDSICKKFNIKNYSINPDGSIDVDGNVELISRNLTKLPLKFRHVNGYFTCYNNQITSLEGCPISVGGNFHCSHNQLTSLKGCPESIGDGFYCSYNQLTSLEDCPISVGGDFSCSYNQIKDFGNKYFKFNDFYCEDNPIKEIYDLNRCKEFIEYLIEYDVIRDGNKIIRIRLEKALEDSGWDGKSEFKFRNYELI